MRDCGRKIHLMSKLDRFAQEKLYEGVVFDLGNDVRYHCIKCVTPAPAQYG